MGQTDAASGRRSRIGLWVGIGVVGVFLLVILALHLYLTPERLRRMIEPQLESALNREVRLESVGLSLWGGIEASVEGLEVSERQGFGDVPFVKADRAALSLDFWPLLKGEARLGKITIESPVVSFVVNEGGITNYADLQEGEKGPSGRPGLPADRMALSRGRIRYEDRRSGTTAVMDGIDYQMRIRLDGERIGLLGDLSVENVEMQASGGRRKEMGGLRASHRLWVDPKADVLVLELLRLGVGPLELQARGTVHSFSGVPNVSVAVEEQTVDLTGLGSYLETIGVDLGGMRIQGQSTVSARIEGLWNREDDPPAMPAISGKAALKGISITTAGMPVPFEIDGGWVEVRQGIFTLSELKARVGRSDVSAAARGEGILPATWGSGSGAPATPYLKASVSSRVLDLDGLLPGLAAASDRSRSPVRGASWTLVSPAHGAEPVGPKESAGEVCTLLRWADADVDLRVGVLTYGQVSYKSLEVVAAAKDDVIRLTRARVQAFGGHVETSAELDLRKPSGPFRVTGSVVADSVRIEQAIRKYLSQDYSVAGTAWVSLEAAGSVDTTLRLVSRQVSGKLVEPVLSGRLRVADLRVKTPDLLVPMEHGKAVLSLEKDVLRISEFEAWAGRSDMSATGRVEGAMAWWLASHADGRRRPYVMLDIRSKILDLDEMIPAHPPAAPPGLGGSAWGFTSPAFGGTTGGARDETSPILWVVRTADGEGTLSAGELKSDGVVYRDLRADAAAKEGILELNNVRGEVYGGVLKARIKLDARPPSGYLPTSMTVSVDSVQAQGLIREFLGWPIPVHGQMSLSMALVGAMDSILELVPGRIDAEGSAGMREGKVVNWEWLKKAGSGVTQLGFLDFEEIPIRAMKASFRVKDSRVALDDVQLRAADVPCRLSGSAGFDGSLGYVLDVDLPTSRMDVGGLKIGSALTSFLGANASYIPLRIHIKGSVERPEMSMGMQPGAESGAAEKQEEAKEKLKEKAKGFLRKLF